MRVEREFVSHAVPDGWYRVRLPRRETTPQDFIEALVDNAWYPVYGERPAVRFPQGGVRYVRPLSQRLLRLCRGALRFLCLRRKPALDPVRKLGYWVWRKECGENLRRCQLFSRAGFA